MVRSRKPKCRLCMKPTNRDSLKKMENLPKSFAKILEEMSGVKFTDAEKLNILTCLNCNDFLKAMDTRSQYPTSNKMSGAGRKRVLQLMDGGMPAAIAIEKVLAETRARKSQYNAETGLQGGIPNASVQKQLGLEPSMTWKMSGSQRKKVSILVAGGMDRTAARELVLAASRAAAATRVPSSERNTSRRGGQPNTSNAQAASVRQGTTQKAPQRNAGRQNASNVAIQKAPVQMAQKNQNSQARRAPIQKPVANVASNIQQNRQNNKSGGRNINSDKRVGAQVASRRNERPTPYDIRGNNRQQIEFGPQNQFEPDFNQEPCPIDVGIVPINFPNAMLDDMKLDALKEAITNEILKIQPGGPLIRFLGTTSENGWLKLTCADELSHNWLAMLVSRWERAGVRLVEGDSLPQDVVLSVYLQNDFRSPEEIFNIIARQNNSLNTNLWRLVNRETDQNGQSITIYVDGQSFEALQRLNFYVFLGLGRVEFQPRPFPSGGLAFNNNNMSNQNSMGNNNFPNNYSNNGNNLGFSNSGSNSYQMNRSNNSGGGGSYQRQGISQGQGYQRSGYQNQRSW